jgi:hypothetical protein
VRRASTDCVRQVAIIGTRGYLNCYCECDGAILAECESRSISAAVGRLYKDDAALQGTWSVNAIPRATSQNAWEGLNAAHERELLRLLDTAKPGARRVVLRVTQ